MRVSVSVETWKIMRFIKRDSRRAVPGKELRFDFTRRTKDGSFLTKLADQGFLQMMYKVDNPFDCSYFLTELGEKVAEYGEYEESDFPGLGLFGVKEPGFGHEQAVINREAKKCSSSAKSRRVSKTTKVSKPMIKRST